MGMMTLASVDAEALGPLVLGVDEGLEGLGEGELLKDVPLFEGRERGAVLGVLHPRDEPSPPVAVEQRHELHADAAAVGTPQPVEQVPKPHPSFAGEYAAAVDYLVQLRWTEGLVGDHRQVRRVLERRSGTPQRVELGEEVAAEPKGVQRLVDPRLQSHPRRGDGGRLHRKGQRRRAIARRARAVAIRRLGDTVRGERATAAGVGEDVAPAGIDTARVLQPSGVEALDEVDVGPGEEAVLGRHKESVSEESP